MFTTLIPIELGGQTRNLRITFGTMLRFETGGKSLMSEETWADMDIFEVVQLVSDSLQHESPGLSPDTVAGWINMDNLPEIFKQLGEAWKASWGVEQGVLPLEVTPETQVPATL